MEMTVRSAEEGDAEEACDVVRRSIQELCIDDHGQDEGILGAWLGNKTVAWFRQLILSDSPSCVVVRAGRICGFGQMNSSGEIALLYVAPETRFLGVSTLMLEWLESRAAALGREEVRLRSTSTAKRFYEARGYRQAGAPSIVFGLIQSWPMVKHHAP